MQLGSMFISNCNNALHVSDAFCVHPQEHLETVVASSGLWHETGWSIQLGRPRSMASALSHIVYRTIVFKCSWGWTQKASETCRVLLQLLINVLPSCIKVGSLCIYMYSLFNISARWGGWSTSSPSHYTPGKGGGFRCIGGWLGPRFLRSVRRGHLYVLYGTNRTRQAMYV